MHIAGDTEVTDVIHNLSTSVSYFENPEHNNIDVIGVNATSDNNHSLCIIKQSNLI